MDGAHNNEEEIAVDGANREPAVEAPDPDPGKVRSVLYLKISS